MSKLSFAAIASIFLMVVLVAAAMQLAKADRINDKTTVQVYCAAGVAEPIERAIAAFNRQHDTRIVLARTGGSGELMGQVCTEHETGITRGADLIVSADEDMLKMMKTNGVIEGWHSLGTQRPVIATRIDEDIQLESLQQLATQTNVKFGIASEQAAIGKLAREIAEQIDVLDQLESNKSVECENVMVLAQALQAGSIQAAILWDTTVHQVNSNSPSLKILAPAHPHEKATSLVGVGVVQSSQDEPAIVQSATDFVLFLSNSEISQTIFAEHGYSGEDSE